MNWRTHVESLEGPCVLLLALAFGGIVSGKFRRSQIAFESALKRGASPQACLEIAASAHLFCGFPRAINGLESLWEILETRGIKRSTMALDEKDQSATWPVRGEALFRSIYSHSADSVLDHLESLHPPFRRWILEHAYGRVLGRPEVSADMRELIAIAALVVLDVPRQLRSHLRGALRLGVPKEEIIRVVETMKPLCSEDQHKSSQEALKLEGLTGGVI